MELKAILEASPDLHSTQYHEFAEKLDKLKAVIEDCEQEMANEMNVDDIDAQRMKSGRGVI